MSVMHTNSSALSTPIQPELVDRMIELYCDWRTTCSEVRAAYEGYLHASASDRAVAFAAYGAALDREQCVCEAYAKQVRLIQSHFTGTVAHRASPSGCR